MSWLKDLFTPIPPDPPRLFASKQERQHQESMGKLTKSSTKTMGEQVNKAPPPLVTWTAADQEELDRLKADRAARNVEEREKYFMGLPEEIRIKAIEQVQFEAVQQALQGLRVERAMYTQREMDLESKQYQAQHHGFMGTTLKMRDEPDHIATYQELSKMHAEASTREIILNDKEK